MKFLYAKGQAHATAIFRREETEKMSGRRERSMFSVCSGNRAMFSPCNASESRRRSLLKHRHGNERRRGTSERIGKNGVRQDPEADMPGCRKKSCFRGAASASRQGLMRETAKGTAEEALPFRLRASVRRTDALKGIAVEMSRADVVRRAARRLFRPAPAENFSSFWPAGRSMAEPYIRRTCTTWLF